MKKEAIQDSLSLSPVAIIRIQDKKIFYANEEALALLECTQKDLINDENWATHLFTNNVEAWEKKIFTSTRKFVSGEITTFKGNKKYIQVKKNETKDILALIDLTDQHEDIQVLQAGYDEFIKVTTELEQAVSTIEEQKELLEKQAEKLQDELKIARKVQTQVFATDFSEFHSITVAGFYEAMEDLGGDMWFFHQTTKSFTAVIGDVMGHGVAASLISIAAKTIFQKYIEMPNSESMGLEEICTRINSELIGITQGDYYITIGIFRINNKNEMEFITCGHPPLLRFGKESNMENMHQLFISQPMLGIFETVELESQKIQLDTGDRILLFTDCLMEAFDPNGQLIVPEKIYHYLSPSISKTPQTALESILKYHEEFTGNPDRQDDLAMICIEIEEPKKI